MRRNHPPRQPPRSTRSRSAGSPWRHATTRLAARSGNARQRRWCVLTRRRAARPSRRGTCRGRTLSTSRLPADELGLREVGRTGDVLGELAGGRWEPERGQGAQRDAAGDELVEQQHDAVDLVEAVERPGAGRAAIVEGERRTIGAGGDLDAVDVGEGEGAEADVAQIGGGELERMEIGVGAQSRMELGEDAVGGLAPVVVAIVDAHPAVVARDDVDGAGEEAVLPGVGVELDVVPRDMLLAEPQAMLVEDERAAEHGDHAARRELELEFYT